jgi:hypothetical protein
MKRNRFLIPVAMTTIAVLFILMVASKSGATLPTHQISQPAATVYTTYLPLVTRDWPYIEKPALAWATSENAVLLRWRWPNCGGNATFNVSRDRHIIAHDIGKITDEAAAIQVLGSDWNWIRERYTDVTTIAGLHAKLAANPLLADQLANTHYRVALVLGWGFMDETAIPGTTYDYRVTKVQNGQSQVAGPVTIVAGQITPLDAPTILQAVAVISSSLQGSPDWAMAQLNRKADRKIYLRWDLPGEGSQPSAWPSTWNASYDIYRATNPAGPYLRINIQDGEDRPVLPMPATNPSRTITVPTYSEYGYYYVDDDPALEYGHTYYYRVGARDLLGQSRRWPADQSQFSDPVSAVPQDTLPPLPPEGLTATVASTSIAITWNPQVTDTVSYRLYRSTSMTASILIANCPGNDELCWNQIYSGAGTSFNDTGTVTDTIYWYRVRAVDAAGNLSAFSEPVYAVVRDTTPPCDPQVTSPEGRIVIRACPQAPDTALYALYCSFDGPELMIAQIHTGTLPQATFDLNQYYDPPYPMTPVCRVQAIDSHFNRGNFVSVPAAPLCPSRPITPITPIITGVTAFAGGVYGAAQIAWSAQTAPGLQEFRIHRYSDGQVVTMTASSSARTFLDDQVKPDQIYSYTVTAVQAGYSCPGNSKPPVLVTSTPVWYQLKPGLECCSHFQTDIDWDPNSYFTPGVGTMLQWKRQPGQEWMLIIVYRSLRADGDYVAITPPRLTGYNQYLDANAEGDYWWYVVAMLDRATGDIVRKTSPWSPSTGAPASASAPITSTLAAALAAPLRGAPPKGASPLGKPADLARLAPPAAPLAARAAPNAPQATHVITLTPSGDTFVSVEAADTNFGTQPFMLASNVLHYSMDHALIRFLLNDLPPGAVIDSAVFQANVTLVWGDVNVNLPALRVTQPWSEIWVTWNNQPATDGSYSAAALGADTGWYSWDLTNLVNEWYNGISPNYGLELAYEGGSYRRQFSTREGANPPRLVITYTTLDNLYFGVGLGDWYTVQSPVFQPDSRLDHLTGYGLLTLGGGALPTFDYTVYFTDVAAFENGIVYNGMITVPITNPLLIAYPGGQLYAVNAITVDPWWGIGNVWTVLPGGDILHWSGIALPIIPLPPVWIHPNLTYIGAWDLSSSCSVVTPTWYVEMNPLPLRIVPGGMVTFTQQTIELGNTCTQYDERYTGGSRPTFPTPDANDGFLRPRYDSLGVATIYSTGLAGEFVTYQPFSYSTAVPYDFRLTSTNGAAFELVGNQIDNGIMTGVDLAMSYYQATTASIEKAPPPPTGQFTAHAATLAIGHGGSVWGMVETSLLPDLTPPPVTWMHGGFDLRQQGWTLYLPPVQTPGYPWQETDGAWEGDARIQPGLNIVTDPGESVDFTWSNCNGPRVNFPDGVSADLYLRRGGVSDYITASISLNQGLPMLLYGYTTRLNSFRVAFCDSGVLNRDIAGDVTLDWPADVILQLTNMRLDEKACVKDSDMRDDPLMLGYWQTRLQPKAVVFKPNGLPDPWSKAAWVQGKVYVPHVALARTAGIASPIPLEVSFRPEGTFYGANLVADQAHYGFDTFDFLLSQVRLSDWSMSGLEQPNWVQEATLRDPPSCCQDPQTDHGFLALKGNLVVPYWGALQGPQDGPRPELRVLAWDDYVGFTSRPRVGRIWNLLVTQHEYDFDLVYAHRYSGDNGVFVGFRADDLKVVSFDSGVVISSTETGIYLGLSSGTGVLRALAETIVSPLPASLEDPLKSQMKNDWAPRLNTGTDTMSAGYVDCLSLIWSNYVTYSASYTRTTEMIDYLVHDEKDDIPVQPTGGETAWWMSKVVTLKKIRGDVIFQDVYDGSQLVDSHLDGVRVSTWFELKNPKTDKTIVQGDRLTFEITSQGEYRLHGQQVRATVYEQNVIGDFTLQLNLPKQRLEGGVLVYDFKYDPVEIKRASLVLGAGSDIAYLGALVEGSYSGINLGGAVLFGVIDPGSQVLQDMGFGEIITTVRGITPTGPLMGGYLRVHGDFPLYNKGCIFRLNVGGDIAVWYFEGGGTNRYGGHLIGYVYGKALCLFSARGDVTLSFVKPGRKDASSYSLAGQLWVAGGFGFCEPETWDTWENRWWNDSWCYTCGAMVGVNYNDDKQNDWAWSYGMECE